MAPLLFSATKVTLQSCETAEKSKACLERVEGQQLSETVVGLEALSRLADGAKKPCTFSNTRGNQEMQNALYVSISPDQIINAVKEMAKEEQSAFIEDLLSSVSPEYLASIREARKDYKDGQTSSHDKAFG